MRLIYLMLVCCFWTLSWAGDKVQPSALVHRAAEVSDIRGPGAAPFRLKAKVRTYGENKDEATYELVWVSPDQWREEIVTGDEKAIRIGGAGTVSIKNDNIKARIIRGHIRKLDIPATLALRSQEYLAAGVRSTKRNGLTLQCATRKGKYSFEAELCFEPEKGILAVENYIVPGQDGSVVLFLSYTNFGSKLFPARVEAYNSGALTAGIEVVTLDEITPPQSSVFETGAGYATMAGCETPLRPFAMSHPPPMYYPNSLEEKWPKNIRVSILVDQDGTVKNPTASQSTALEQRAVDAVSRWKFSPAMCGPNPVPLPIEVEVYFQGNSR